MMDFFSGFKWAIPKAFSDAISLCRFVEGDVLYDTEYAYCDDWKVACKHIGLYLQVRSTPGVKAEVNDGSNNLLIRNWYSEVIVDLYQMHDSPSFVQINTTQGRLYTAFWKGDIKILNKNTEKPEIPLFVKKVTKELSKPHIKIKAEELSSNSPVFVMACDNSNHVSREKYLKVYFKLKPHLLMQPVILSPKEAGLVPFNNIAPTVEIIFFVTKDVSNIALEDLIKSVVYNPSKNAKEPKFYLSRHGVIFDNNSNNEMS